MTKAKEDYYENLNEKDVIDNKTFWKKGKTLLSDKVKSSEKIASVHEDKIITNDDENASIIWIRFFWCSKSLENSGIQRYWFFSRMHLLSCFESNNEVSLSSKCICC